MSTEVSPEVAVSLLERRVVRHGCEAVLVLLLLGVVVLGSPPSGPALRSTIVVTIALAAALGWGSIWHIPEPLQAAMVAVAAAMLMSACDAWSIVWTLPGAGTRRLVPAVALVLIIGLAWPLSQRAPDRRWRIVLTLVGTLVIAWATLTTWIVTERQLVDPAENALVTGRVLLLVVLAGGVHALVLSEQTVARRVGIVALALLAVGVARGAL